MKMKKSTWLLLVLAIAAIFLVAGCAPTGPGEEPGGEEPPITPPPADTACPKVVSTVVSKLYAATAADPNFQIKITFDEDFNSSCIENLAKWAITVANTDRVGTPVVSGVSVSVSGKVVTVKARVVETKGPDTIITDDYEKLFGAIADALEDADIDALIAALEDLIAALGRLSDEDYEALLDALNPLSLSDLVDALLGCEVTDLAGWARDIEDLEDLVVALENLVSVLEDPAQNALIAALEDLVDALKGTSRYALIILIEGCPVLGCVPTEEEPCENCAADLSAALEDLLCCPFVVKYTDAKAPVFYGLICNKEDAAAYKGLFGEEVKAADEVSWKLTDCAVYDDLGNVCCEFSGKACCVEPYCEECPPPCDLTEAGACL